MESVHFYPEAIDGYLQTEISLNHVARLETIQGGHIRRFGVSTLSRGSVHHLSSNKLGKITGSLDHQLPY